MSKKRIDKAEFVSVRDVFAHEAHDFTKWLADNIDALSERLGMKLSILHREAAVGVFRVDLLCKDEHGNTVIIENQLERSDHKHLGQISTYIANLDAKAAIWITPEPRPEHCRAIDDLNARFGSERAYYMVKVEAVRVDQTRYIPIFSIFSGPDSSGFSPMKLSVQEAKPQISQETQTTKSKLAQNLWCIRPKKDTATHRFFFEHSHIRMTFADEIGDLSKQPPTPDAFRQLFRNLWPTANAYQIGTFQAMFYRFVHLAEVKDFVVYPTTWLDRQISVARITGPYVYRYRTGLLKSFFHLRPVEWLYSLSRDDFSPEALRGIGGKTAFFQVHNEQFVSELERLGSSQPT